jgi:hypothetical protein
VLDMLAKNTRAAGSMRIASRLLITTCITGQLKVHDTKLTALHIEDQLYWSHYHSQPAECRSCLVCLISDHRHKDLVQPFHSESSALCMAAL